MLNLPWTPASVIAGPTKAIGAMGEGGGGGGVGAFLNKLVGDDRFWQYIFATGQDMLQNTPGKNIGAAFNQNLSADNLKGVMEQILKGGGAITSKDGTLTLKIPNADIEKAAGFTQPGDIKPLSGSTGASTTTPKTGDTAPTGGNMQSSQMMDFFNQFEKAFNPI